EAEVPQLKGSAAERDGPLGVERFVRQHRVRIIDHGKPLLGPLVRDHGRPGVLECFAASDVVKVVVAIDQILDRLVSDLLNFVDIRLSTGRPAISNGVGSYHPVIGNDEHRLMVDIAEDVNVAGPFDLSRLDRWPAWLSRLALSRTWSRGEQTSGGGRRGK